MQLSIIRTLGLAALALLVAHPALADRRVRIHNTTGYTLHSFTSTNSGSKKWGRDVLGSGVLPSGKYIVLNFDNAKGYCLFDFRATFADGTRLERYNVNVCQIADYYYQP